jgi:hypothetical protein
VFFSTYKRLAYAGLIIFPFFVFGAFYVTLRDPNGAIGWTVIFTLIIAPLQLWQLRRMKSRLDDHGGSIPLGWAFDWDLEDDSEDDVDPSDLGFDGEGLESGRQIVAQLDHDDPQARTPDPPTPPIGDRSSPTSAMLADRTRVGCPRCGAIEPAAGSRYCRSCGAALGA